MNNEMAFALGMLNRGNEPRVFDWDKAARLIAERKPKYADAFLRSDREWTGGTIYEDGEPVFDSYTYLASTWAIPVLEMDGEEIPCWVMAHETDWDEVTKWPESALRILRGEEPSFQHQELPLPWDLEVEE